MQDYSIKVILHFDNIRPKCIRTAAACRLKNIGLSSLNRQTDKTDWYLPYVVRTVRTLRNENIRRD